MGDVKESVRDTAAGFNIRLQVLEITETIDFNGSLRSGDIFAFYNVHLHW